MVQAPGAPGSSEASPDPDALRSQAEPDFRALPGAALLEQVLDADEPQRAEVGDLNGDGGPDTVGIDTCSYCTSTVATQLFDG